MRQIRPSRAPPDGPTTSALSYHRRRQRRRCRQIGLLGRPMPASNFSPCAMSSRSAVFGAMSKLLAKVISATMRGSSVVNDADHAFAMSAASVSAKVSSIFKSFDGRPPLLCLVGFGDQSALKSTPRRWTMVARESARPLFEVRARDRLVVRRSKQSPDSRGSSRPFQHRERPVLGTPYDISLVRYARASRLMMALRRVQTAGRC